MFYCTHASFTPLFCCDLSNFLVFCYGVCTSGLPHFLVTRIVKNCLLWPFMDAFNPHEEDWSEYAERLSFCFTVNGITGNAKKRAILLSSVGPPTFRLMRSLVLP